MNYWMTTHWPPSEGEGEDYIPSGVWLPNGREQAGEDLEIGDKVLIYESENGRTEIKNIKGKLTNVHSRKGKQGIIEIAEVVSDLEALKDKEPSKYLVGADIWWRWLARTQPISMNGFVSRLQVNRILGYKPKNFLHAFGDHKSGLKKLCEEQYYALVEEFNKHPRKINLVRAAKNNGGWVPHDEGGESDEHRALKEFVASNPSKILGERGLTTVKVEYPFPSGDRADIVLKDFEGRIIGVEIELNVENNQLVGALQAIKYRYMLALMEERKFFETRAFLIAKSISKDIKELCKEYEVEYFIINNC